MDLDETADRVRPGPLAWIRYAYGAGLPPRNRTWVLHHVITRTWVLRHILRGIIQFLPFALIVLFAVPVDKAILGVGLGVGLLIGLGFSTAFVDNAAESRAMKAGYQEGYAADRRARLRRAEEIYREQIRAVGRGPLLRLWPRKSGGGPR